MKILLEFKKLMNFFDVNELMKNVENDDNFEINLNISNEFIIESIVVLIILMQIEILKFKKKQLIVLKNNMTMQNIAAIRTTVQRRFEKIEIKKSLKILKTY